MTANYKKTHTYLYRNPYEIAHIDTGYNDCEHMIKDTTKICQLSSMWE